MTELTPIQSRVLAGLLAGGTIAAVAREHKIHRSTIYNWRHEHSAFAFALSEARARQRIATYDAAQDLAARAYETLAALLVSDREQTRLRAAQAILNAVGREETEVAGTVQPHEARLYRQAAIRRVAPQDLPLLTRGPIEYPDASGPIQFDTIRRISTPGAVSRVEPSVATVDLSFQAKRR